MKTKIKRHSRAVISVILAVCMLISCMTVGIIASDAAYVDSEGLVGYDTGTNVTIYYDNSDTQWDNVYFRIGKDSYASEYKMTLVSGTSHIYSKTLNSKWEGYAAFNFSSGNGSTGNIYTQPDDSETTVNKKFALATNASYYFKGFSSEDTWLPCKGATGLATEGTASDYTTTTKTVSVNSVNDVTLSAAYTTGSGGTINEGGSATILIGSNITVTASGLTSGKGVDSMTVTYANNAAAGVSSSTDETSLTTFISSSGNASNSASVVSAVIGTRTTALEPTPTIAFNNSSVTASSATNVTLTVTNHSSITASDQTVSYDLFKSETSGGTYTKMDDEALTNAGITYSNGVFTIPAKYSNTGYYKVQAVPTNNTDTKHESDLSAYAQLTVTRTDLAQPTISLDKASANLIGSDLDPVVVTVTNYTSASLKDYCTFSLSGATGTSINTDGQITLTGGVTAAYDGHDNSVTVTATLNEGLSEYYTINGSPTSSASAAKTLTVYKPAYSLLGNVNSEYLVGSQATTNGWNDTGVGYQSAVAINTVTETPGKYSITVRTQDKQTLNDKSHTTINLGVVNESGQQYGFVKGTSSDVEYWYNNVGSDYVVPVAGVASSDNFYVHIMDAKAPGGSFVIQPNTTYTIFVDQTKKFDDSNKLGQIYIDVNTYHVNTRTMVQTLNPNTGDYNAIAAAPSYVGTATASPTSGSAAAAFNSTLTATTDATLYNFEGWFNEKTCIDPTDLASTDNPYTASITSGSTFYALFKEKEITYTLSAVADNPEGYEGTVAAGTYYPGSDNVYKGATVTFTATPAAGTKVEGWYVNGKLQNGALGNTFTLSNINENTVVTAKFKVKTTEPVTVRVNDSDLGSAAVTQVAGAAPGNPVVAADGNTVQVTLTAAGEGAPSSITVKDDVTGEAVTPTQVSKDSDTAVYTFTMPENSVTVLANFVTYSGTSSYYFDGRKADKTVKSNDYKNIAMSEAKYNGQKYAYYRVNYDSESSSKYYFTVKTNTTADLSSDGYIYALVQGKDTNDGWVTNTLNIRYYDGTNWSTASSMGFVTQYQNGKEKKWKANETVPSGTTKIRLQVLPGGESEPWIKEYTLSSLGNNGKGGFIINNEGSSTTITGNWAADSASDIYVYSTSSSSPAGMYLMTDSPATYYGTSETNLAAANITATSTILPTVTNLSKPFYVLVFYPNTNYGKLAETDASAFNNTNATPKIIVSKVLPGGTPPLTPVDVYAKDGTIRDGYQVQSEAATTTITKIVAPDGTTLYQNTAADTTEGKLAHGNVNSGTTVSTAAGTISALGAGITYTPYKEGNGDPGSWYEKITSIPKGSTVTVRTVLSDTKNMFAEAKGSGKSFRETHYVKGYSCNGVTYALHDYDASGVYTEDIKIPDSVSIDNFEITPVYYLKDTSNCKTFILTGFDKSVQSTGWGNTLAAYPYYYNTSHLKAAFGGYPGSPLLFFGGTYMIQIPVTNDGTDSGKEIRGITLSNYYWDTVHRSVDSAELNDHRQTYDYDDFVKIYKEKNPDNIYLSYKYRTNKDNLGQGYHKTINQGGASITYSDFAGTSGNGVEDYVDALGRKIDIFGNVLTSADLTAAGNAKVLIVSDGYCHTYAGNYATEWTIYKTTNGTTYTKVSKGVAPSVLYMNDEDSWNKKYTGYADSSSGKLAYYKDIYTALKKTNANGGVLGLPAEITYERELKNDADDIANRLDARWLYSFNSDKISANVKIEYLPLNASAYVEDPFTAGTATGSTTGTKAYFTNYTPKDVYGQTTATDFVIDPDNNFTMLAEETTNYEFVGWYVQYDGHDGETLVSKAGALDGASPIVANATYIARFRQVQSGSLNVSHTIKTDGTYKGTGTPYMLYVIKDGDGTVRETNGKFEISATTNFKNSTYIKTKYSDYTIDVYLATVPNAGCTFGQFDDSGVPAGFKLDKDNTSLPTLGGAAVTVPEGAYNKYAKASFTVAQVLADTTNNGVYPYYSQITLTETHSYRYDITYAFVSRKWGTQKYNVNGDLSEGQVKAYVDGTQTSATLKKLFLDQQKPYESNFLQKFDWNLDGAVQSCSDIGSDVNHIYKITATVPSNQDENLKVRADFNVPYDTINGEPKHSGNGLVAYNDDAESIPLSSNFLCLFQKDNSAYHFDDTGITTKYASDLVTPDASGKTYREYAVELAASTLDEKYDPTKNSDWLGHLWSQNISANLNLLYAPDAIYKLKTQYDTFEANYSYDKTDAQFETEVTDARLREIMGRAVDADVSDVTPAERTALAKTFRSYDEHNDWYIQYEDFYETVNHYYTVELHTTDRTYNVTLAGQNYSYTMDEYVESYSIEGIASGADMSKFDKLDFYRWKIQSTSKAASSAKTVAYCYDKEFNFTGFENYTVTPEFYTAADLATLKADEPDAAASVTFLENSRNQWNILNTENPAYYSAAHQTQGKSMVKADKLFADFNLAFNYNDTVINQNNNIKVGVLIQQLDLLDELSTGKPVTDPKYYAGKTTVSSAEITALENLAKTTTKTSSAPGHITINDRIANNLLSSKNRIEYYYTFNNKSVVYSDNPREFSDTTDRNYVYRAFSYIYDTTTGNVYLSSEPAYFTLYDVATK